MAWWQWIAVIVGPVLLLCLGYWRGRNDGYAKGYQLGSLLGFNQGYDLGCEDTDRNAQKIFKARGGRLQ